tara:strand:- start:275 stop:412 length:138 start_codon:yes stop_codon:yes gene_type:complete
MDKIRENKPNQFLRISDLAQQVQVRRDDKFKAFHALRFFKNVQKY